MSTDDSSALGIAAPEIVASLSGLEFMRRIRDGHLPQAPLVVTLGFRMTGVEEGSTVFEGTPSANLYNPVGTVHGGWFGAMLDSCMGCAIHTTLEKGDAYTTVEYKVNLVRAVYADSGPVRAEGHVVHRGRRVATAEGRLVDRNGKLLAHGTTTCMIMPMAKPAAA